MNNVIYQYWNGNNPPQICQSSIDNMAEYSKRIDAKHRVDFNPNFSLSGTSPKYAAALRPIWDEQFDEFDNILFVDMDIFAVENLQDNIFEQGVTEFGICTEPHKIEIRKQRTSGISAASDRRWDEAVYNHYGKRMPRDANNDIKIYNTGVVLYTKKGLQKARVNFDKPAEYIKKVKSANLDQFYIITDQPYLHSQASVFLDVTELDNGWNSYIHWAEDKTPPRKITDMRTDQTKFVHVMLRGHRDRDKDTYYRMVNLPQEEWNL